MNSLTIGTTEKHYVCPVCKKRFKTSRALDQHCKSTDHKKEGILCPYCKRSFKNENSMNQHVISGACKKKKLICSHCSKSFKSFMC